VRTEEVIYSLMSYNGRDYSPTFARQAEPTICVIADSDSFATVRTTLTYFWPTTGEWYTDSRALNVSHEGVLELTDRRGRRTRVAPVPYTYFSVHERYTQSWQVRTGAEALAEWERYSRLAGEYQSASMAYGAARSAWEEEYGALANRIAAMRAKGLPVDAELARLEAMKPPEEPRESSDYIVPPVPVRTGFVLHLDPGTYSARLVTPEGRVLEGSDKTIIAFSRRASGIVGYDLIPSDRWTRSAESNTPASVIYTTGDADLYLRPFYQDEYNDLYYRKTISNAATGNPTLMKWVKVRQVEQAVIEVAGSGGALERVTEAPFVVVQAEGSTLGYSIVPFDPATAEEGTEATLRAFSVKLDPDERRLELRLHDAEGRMLESGGRRIRIVRVPQLLQATLLFVLLPPIAGVVVLLRRRRQVER